MKCKSGLAVMLLLLALACPFAAEAQEEGTGAQQSVESLRSQLQEVEAKQAALEARLKELDEAMRPENIERSLALTGSTRPEELRARRREQLEKQRAGLQAQLDQLATSRERLQAALSAAETTAYQQSGGVNTTPPSRQTGAEAVQTQTQATRSAQAQPRPTRRRARRARTRRRS